MWEQGERLLVLLCLFLVSFKVSKSSILWSPFTAGSFWQVSLTGAGTTYFLVGISNRLGSFFPVLSATIMSFSCPMYYSLNTIRSTWLRFSLISNSHFLLPHLLWELIIQLAWIATCKSPTISLYTFLSWYSDEGTII